MKFHLQKIHKKTKEEADQMARRKFQKSDVRNVKFISPEGRMTPSKSDSSQSKGKENKPTVTKMTIGEILGKRKPEQSTSMMDKMFQEANSGKKAKLLADALIVKQKKEEYTRKEEMFRKEYYMLDSMEWRNKYKETLASFCDLKRENTRLKRELLSKETTCDECKRVKTENEKFKKKLVRVKKMMFE